ncbi:hypothetical protein [Streptacidiphilus sp. PAMC 29251]
MGATRPRARARGARGSSSPTGLRRGGYLGLALVAAVLTVVLPALLAPGHKSAAARRPVPAASAPAAVPAPVPSTAAATTSAPVPTTAPARLNCAPSTPGRALAQNAGRPSCLLYASALGTGWQLTGTGAKVAPGEQVTGSGQPSIRVDRRNEDAAVTFTAAAPVTLAPGSKLRLRLYGGRQYGTVLRISASADPAVRNARTWVTAQSGPEQWSEVVVDLGGFGLRAIRRIDLVVAQDQLPQTYHFFLDDVVLAP